DKEYHIANHGEFYVQIRTFLPVHGPASQGTIRCSISAAVSSPLSLRPIRFSTRVTQWRIRKTPPHQFVAFKYDYMVVKDSLTVWFFSRGRSCRVERRSPRQEDV